MLVSSHAKPLTRPSRRKYSCDERYFRALTPESAYWLGFMMADGNVYIRTRHGKHQFVVRLYSNDKSHLECFRSCIGGTQPVRNTHAKVHAIEVLSYEMSCDLEKHGVVPDKSKQLKFPKIPTRLLPHLWRGLIDGDGSFNMYRRPSRAKKRNGKGRPAKPHQEVFQLSICGSYWICCAFKRTFGGSMYRVKGVFAASVTGAAAMRAIVYMYKNPADISLDRKRNIAIQHGILER